LSIERRLVDIPVEQFVEESVSIVKAAQERDVCIRILGGLAIYIHSDKSEECRRLQLSLGRLGEGKPPFTDLDVIGYNKQWKQIREVLEKGCQLRPDRMVNAIFGDRRLVYFHPRSRFPIDVFFDALEYSHIIRFGEYPDNARLMADFPTISLADIALEKLQIHEINKKDLIDLMVLLLGHEVSQGSEPDKIDAGYVSAPLSDDWGFWYDATNNLGRVRKLGEEFAADGRLDRSQWSTISGRIDALLKVIADKEKTPDWKLRAEVGTSKPWFREITDL
jgi:hypothetical protein